MKKESRIILGGVLMMFLLCLLVAVIGLYVDNKYMRLAFKEEYHLHYDYAQGWAIDIFWWYEKHSNCPSIIIRGGDGYSNYNDYVLYDGMNRLIVNYQGGHPVGVRPWLLDATYEGTK